MGLSLVCCMAADRVGVSARFDDLRDTPHALHQGDAAGPRRPRISGRVFDGSILATAAVSAPQIVVNSVGGALGGFRDLPDAVSEILVATFRVWQDNDSVRVTARQLVVHPNTVRHRLRRIKNHTAGPFRGRAIVAELCLGFEVHRRFM
jgi:hypothetical protein